jgi:hypothetical protein
VQRTAVADLMEALPKHHARMGDYFVRSLREQVSDAETAARSAAAGHARPPSRSRLALVDEEEVAMDVQLSHCIEAIKSVAEYELRELQTYTSALVGDMDVARDHNPFRAETFARALWAASQALPMSRGTRSTSCATRPRRWRSCCAAPMPRPRRGWKPWAWSPPPTAR